jgi:DNA-binding XRE family transcriptional regulator
MCDEILVGIQIHEFSEPDVKAICECIGLSQSQFAHFISIKVKTLHDWEQRWIRPFKLRDHLPNKAQCLKKLNFSLLAVVLMKRN